MALPFIILFNCMLFALQLVFCFKAEHRWIRLAPLTLTMLADLVCWALYFSGIGADIYGAAFAFYITGILLILALGAELLAWGVYIIVKYVQNRRK